MASLRGIRRTYWLSLAALTVLTALGFFLLTGATSAQLDQVADLAAATSMRQHVIFVGLHAEGLVARPPDERPAARERLLRTADSLQSLAAGYARRPPPPEHRPAELLRRVEAYIDDARAVAGLPDEALSHRAEQLQRLATNRRELHGEIDAYVDHRQEALRAAAQQSLRQTGLLLGGVLAGLLAAASLVFRKLERRLGSEARRIQRTAEELGQQKGLFSAVLESMADGVVVTDAGGRLVLSNAACEEMREVLVNPFEPGAAALPVLQEDGEAPLRPDDLPLVRVLRGEPVDRDVLHVPPEGAGPGRWFEISGRPLRPAEGGPAAGAVLVCREITERRLAAQELEVQAGELERSNLDLQRFASMASHDLQEPLRMVVRFTELLRRRHGRELGEDAEDLMRYIVDGGQRMQQLIRDLLAYARLQSADAEPEPVDLDAALDRALQTLELAIEDAGAAVEREPLPTVPGNPVQLAQVFQNLIGNALKFRGQAPLRIRIGAAHRGGAWQVTVTDNGIGFAQKNAARIFEPFQRLHTGNEYPGTGMGLALCKRVIERHGGRIWAEAAPGGGARVSFALPARQRVGGQREGGRSRAGRQADDGGGRPRASERGRGSTTG